MAILLDIQQAYENWYQTSITKYYLSFAKIYLIEIYFTVIIIKLSLHEENCKCKRLSGYKNVGIIIDN